MRPADATTRRGAPAPARAAPGRRVLPVDVAVALAGAALAACGSGGPSPATSAPATTAPTAAARAAIADGADPAATDAAGVEWLCRPGHAPDPCTADLDATVVHRTGPDTTQPAAPAAHPPVDCFYVYPTVSTQQTTNADLAIDPAETGVARAQASRFSQVCRVYAPMYRQLTLRAIAAPGPSTVSGLATAYAGVVAAWRDYLAHDNHGRGFVLIGHSQGASLLIRLIRSQIDGDPAVRRRLVSAVILGGNVTVPVGGVVGGTFAHVPACTSATQTGCVVAYSSFDRQPPADSLFGRPGAGVSLLSGQTASAGLQVLCVNPAAPGGGTAPLIPYFPSRSAASGIVAAAGQLPSLPTPWFTEPGLYTGTCTSAGGASWLQVSGPTVPGDPRAVVHETLGPTWGLHLVDVNIALGNLVDLVRSEAAAYQA